MKSSVVAISLIILLTSPVLAQSPGKKTLPSASPLTKPVTNQNQVTTMNQGQEQQLRLETQKHQSSPSSAAAGIGTQAGNNPRSQTAREHMSLVAKQIEQLLATPLSGGIGQQVREIARTQQSAQTQIDQQLAKLESKTGIAKLIFGPDLTAINTLNQQLEQTRLRIQQLTQLKQQIKNQADQVQIEAAIQTLTQQNTALINQLEVESSTPSLFGWLIKLFHR